ncbi:U4/U6.U5 tri-snRNP component SNU23 [Clonorchis sinensis]|uniref:U4/U6.U5 tri-snRNP component SNU23 n=1 Tax=Clonorchis sinensis TaxID=79923 RepID=G7YJ86_CLOSI|nr:U4/U6.U5 tri-snRNP component SNU23 [Clonorchis sinensis]
MAKVLIPERRLPNSRQKSPLERWAGNLAGLVQQPPDLVRNGEWNVNLNCSSEEEINFLLHKRRNEEKAEEYNLDERMRQIAEEEEKLRAYRSEKRREKKRKNEEPVDEDVAAVMGFGGFGKRSK